MEVRGRGVEGGVASTGLYTEVLMPLFGRSIYHCAHKDSERTALASPFGTEGRLSIRIGA